MNRATERLVLTVVFALGGCLLASAQNGQVSGQVTDPQGGAVPEAQVQVLNLDTQAKSETKTNESGSYTVPNLPAGRYRVTVEAKGFAKESSTDVTLTAGQAVAVPVQLQVESETTSVEVQGGGAAQVKTESAEIAGTITSTEIISLGLNGRNFTQLITLTPGVSNQTGQDEGKVGVVGSAKYSVNGGRVEYNTFEIDGSDVLNNGINASRGGNTLIVYPSLDALQEVKVLTSNYGAMYGRTASGTVLATTKSGGSQFHGNAYEFLRNEKFNARNFFDQTPSAPLYRRNDFGGTLGGPVFIPNRYNTTKDKTFFFFSEEFRKERTPQDFAQAVPTAAERNGIFDDVCPTTGQTDFGYVFAPAQFPDCPLQGATEIPTPLPTKKAFLSFKDNTIEPSVYAQAFLKTGLLPMPNATSGCNSTISSCYVATISPKTSWREELLRLDHTFNQKTQLSARYIHDAWNTTVLTPQWGVVLNSFPTVQNKFVGPGANFVTHLTNTISSTLLNQVGFSYTTDHITLTNVAGPGVDLARPAVLDDPCRKIGSGTGAYFICPLGAIFENGFGGKIPGIVVEGNNTAYGGTGFAMDTSYMPWRHSNPTYAWRDDATKVFGKHTLQFGAQFIFAQQNEDNAVNGANSGDVQGLLRYSNEGGGSNTGNAFANFLTGPSPNLHDDRAGKIKSFQQDSAQFKYYNRYKLAEPYIQDDWRVTSRLTLNLGFRASLFGTWYNKYGTAYNWEPSAYSPSLAALVAVDPTAGYLRDVVTRSPLPFDRNSLDPRITNGLVQCGKNGVPRSCMDSHIFNPAPRIGFAWDPWGDRKTSFRGGYGIFFEHGTSYEANTGSLIGSAPLVLSATQLGPSDYKCIGSGRLTTVKDGHCGTEFKEHITAFPLSVTSIPRKAVYPYAQQWSLGVEREVMPSLVTTVSYVGSKGTHLTAERQINQLAPLPDALNPFEPGQPLDLQACSGGIGPFQIGNKVVQRSQPAYVNLQAACFGNPLAKGAGINPNVFRRYAGFDRIAALDNLANSSYHALQVTVRRTKASLTIGASYTYSHSIDNSSDRADATFVNSDDLASNKASSNFDQRHLLNVSYVYKLPFSGLTRSKTRQSGVTSAVFGGWELSGITTYQSGTPFSVVNGASTSFSSPDNAGVANGEGLGSFADVIGDPYANPGGKVGRDTAKSFGPLLFNPGAFSAPRGLTFGNAGRNALHNPSRLNFDMALLKHFRVLGERDVEFRAEAFNIFNTTQFLIYEPTHPGKTGNNVVSCYGGKGSLYSAGGGDGVDCLAGNSFLHPVDAHRPRTVQFGLKFKF